MLLAPVIKAVRAYDSAEWEIFIREWQHGLKNYLSVQRLGGAGDHGRDVIGLCDNDGCQGVWDNYQCKHYESTLPTSKACEDAGKIIFHAYCGKFAPPRKCIFVAPRGPTTELRDMLLNPAKFKAEVQASWNVRVAGKVVAGEMHKLADALATYVDEYDFTSFGFATIDQVLDGHRQTAYWASRFMGLLPPAPAGVVPGSIQSIESIYVSRLLEVYSEVAGKSFSCVADLAAHAESEGDLQRQRERFFDAEAFVAHYRDQTEPGTVEDFADQVHDAIEPPMSVAPSSQLRLAAALSAAGSASVANVLAPRAKVRVKQGICHQLANAGKLTWKRTSQ